MVLDDASPQEGFVDEAPPNDGNDSYAAGEAFPYLNRYNVDIRKLPKPILIGGHSRAKHLALSKTYNSILMLRMRAVQRPLSQDEADAMLWKEAKSLRTSTMGAPIFGAIGAARAYHTASTFRFPLFQPSPEKFNPNSAFFGILRGSFARAFWHALRGLSYSTSGAFLGTLFVVSPYAAHVMALEYRLDPRLKQYNEDVVRIRKEKTDQLMKKSGGGGQRAGAPGQTHDTRTPEGHAAQQEDGDDMSPTASGFASDNFSGESSTDPGAMSDTQARQYEETTRSGSQNDYTTSRQQQDQREHSEPYQSFTQGDAATQDNPSPRSAWDRVRAHARSPGSSQTDDASPRSLPERGTDRENRDAFSFSSAEEEERELAKSEAQKQFDERIERERQGRNF